MAPTKQIEKTLPAKNLENLTNVPNPNVSSDEASTEVDDQSDHEVMEKVNISDESRTSTPTSLPHSQGSLIYKNPAIYPSPSTAEISATTDLLLDMSYKVAPLIPAAPLLRTLSPRRTSVISCPADTCDEQVIVINLSPQTVPSTEVAPVDRQDEKVIPIPPAPDTDQQDCPSAAYVVLTTGLLRRRRGCLVSVQVGERLEGEHGGGHPGGDGGHRGQGCARLINSPFQIVNTLLENDRLEYILS